MFLQTSIHSSGSSHAIRFLFWASWRPTNIIQVWILYCGQSKRHLDVLFGWHYLFWGIHMLFANQCRGATANSQRLQEYTCLKNLRTIDPNLVTKIAESLDIRWRCLCQWLVCYRYGYSKVQTWSKWLGIHRPQDRCPRLARHQLCLFLQGRPTVHLLQKVQWYMECSFVQSTI